MTHLRPVKAANDNASAAASPMSSEKMCADPVSCVGFKNILGFFELLDGWDRAANDNEILTKPDGKEESAGDR